MASAKPTTARPFAWVEKAPLRGSPAEEAGLGEGDGVVSIGRATAIADVPFEIIEGVPVEFVVVSPVDFQLVHLRVVPRRFNPQMPHSLLGCQLVDNPGGFADPRVQAYGHAENHAAVSAANNGSRAAPPSRAVDVAPAPPGKAVAEMAPAKQRGTSEDDGPSWSSRLWLLVCCNNTAPYAPQLCRPSRALPT